MDGFAERLAGLRPAFFAVERRIASARGARFRPEYRQLAALRTRFPGLAVHAYTATATPRCATTSSPS